MQTTHAEIQDRVRLQLLGDILQLDTNRSATSTLRLKLLQPGFSWQALVELALAQGVLLPLIFALSTRSLSPPIPRSITWEKHVSVQLQGVYALHLAYRQRERQQLEDVLQVLKRARVAPLILKGARYLVAPVDEWCEARAMADFDILIQPGDIQSARTALAAAGYRQASDQAAPYKSAHHLPPLEHPDHPKTLEIHVHPLTAAAATIMNTRQVWDKANTAQSGAFLVLPPIWHAVHGLLHHQVQDRGHVLHKLCIKGLWEWSMLARAFTEDDWNAVRAHMQAARALDILDSWLLQSHRLFGLEVPWLAEICPAAERHADATLRRAFWPYWIRRSRQIADELTVSFARPTLAAKYDVPPAHVSLAHVGRNLMELLQRYHGSVLQRLSGSDQQP